MPHSRPPIPKIPLLRVCLFIRMRKGRRLFHAPLPPSPPSSFHPSFSTKQPVPIPISALLSTLLHSLLVSTFLFLQANANLTPQMGHSKTFVFVYVSLVRCHSVRGEFIIVFTPKVLRLFGQMIYKWGFY